MSRNAEPPTPAVTPTNIAGNSGSPMLRALVIPMVVYSPTGRASNTTHIYKMITNLILTVICDHIYSV
jgi:hypothetical protein